MGHAAPLEDIDRWCFQSGPFLRLTSRSINVLQRCCSISREYLLQTQEESEERFRPETLSIPVLQRCCQSPYVTPALCVFYCEPVSAVPVSSLNSRNMHKGPHDLFILFVFIFSIRNGLHFSFWVTRIREEAVQNGVDTLAPFEMMWYLGWQISIISNTLGTTMICWGRDWEQIYCGTLCIVGGGPRSFPLPIIVTFLQSR